MADTSLGGELAPVMRFDPADWLARFEAAGGHALVDGRNNHLQTGWALDKATGDGLLPRTIYAEVEGNRERLLAVKALVPVVLREAI